MSQTQLPSGHPMAVKVYSASGAVEPHRRSASAFMTKKPRRRKRKPPAEKPYRGPRKMGVY